MELVRRNTDFRPQAELEAVGEAGAGIHHDGCGIDLREEALGPSVVHGDDGLRMRGPVAGDVRYGVIDGRHHSNCEHRPEVFLTQSSSVAAVALGTRHRPQGSPEARRLWPQGSRPPAAESARLPFVNKKGLKGVADPIAMGLAVEHKRLRHGVIGARVHIKVAVAI